MSEKDTTENPAREAGTSGSRQTVVTLLRERVRTFENDAENYNALADELETAGLSESAEHALWALIIRCRP